MTRTRPHPAGPPGAAGDRPSPAAAPAARRLAATDPWRTAELEEQAHVAENLEQERALRDAAARAAAAAARR